MVNVAPRALRECQQSCLTACSRVRYCAFIPPMWLEHLQVAITPPCGLVYKSFVLCPFVDCPCADADCCHGGEEVEDGHESSIELVSGL